MTGNDLIVMAPWVIFSLGLATVLLRLHRSRSSSRPHEPASPRAEPDRDQERDRDQAARCTGREAR